MSSARPQSRNADVPSEPSPDRATSQPPANRVLNFGRQATRMSVDNGSPFKPKRVLRRSFGGPRKDQPEDAPELPTADTEITEENEEDSDELEAKAGADAKDGSDIPQAQNNDQRDEPSSDDDAPLMFDNNEDFYDTQHGSDDAEINEALQNAELLLQTTPNTATPTAKAHRRPRKSDQTTISQHTPQTVQTASSSRKRDRTEMEEEEDAPDDDVENQTLQSIEQSQNDVPNTSTTSDNAAKRKRGRPRKSDNVETSQVSATTDNAIKRRPGRPRKNEIPVLQDPVKVDESIHSVEENENENDASQVSAAQESPARKRPGRPRNSDVTVITANEQTVDQAVSAHGDSYLAPINEDDEVEAAPASPITKKKPGRKPKAQKAAKAPKERDPNQSMRRTPSGSPGKANARDLALSRSPSKRAGSVSNVNLRASTPFEDAHQRMSRSGRPILAPLKHWAGESYVWKNGEVEGIIRADEVKTPKGDKKKKAKGRRRAPRAGGRGASNDLDMIAEESDTESTVPDEWEEQVGVIAGTVAAWDPDLQQGIPEDPIREGMLRCLLRCMISANFHRYRVRFIIDCDKGRCWIVLPVRQDYDPPILRLRYCRVAARGIQTREELAQDADGVFRSPRQGSGDGRPACRRAEWTRHIRRRGRDERVRNLQRWCVGRSKRYVFAFLSSLFLHIHTHYISATPSKNARSEKPHYATIADAGLTLSRRSRSEKSGQQYLPAHLQPREPRRRRCEAVCATSRRNDLTIAPKHCTSCVPLHRRQALDSPPTSRHRASFQNQEVLGRVTSQMPARILSSVALHRRHIGVLPAVVRLCAHANPCGTFSCGASCFVFVIFACCFVTTHFLKTTITNFDPNCRQQLFDFQREPHEERAHFLRAGL